jgi:glycosyl transferase family 25
MRSPEVFVINLDRRPDRLAEFDAVARKLGINYRRIAAVDAAKVDPLPLVDWWRSFLFENFNPPVRPQIGIFFSHRRAWQTIVDEEIPQALVCEDDIVPDEYDPDFLHLDIATLGLDLLRLERLDYKQIITPTFRMQASAPQPLDNRRIVFEPSFGSAAYLLTLEGARKCLHNEKFWFHVDHFDCHEHSVGLRSGLLLPTLFRQSSSPSDNSWFNRVDWATLSHGIAGTSEQPWPLQWLRQFLVWTHLLSLVPWPLSHGLKSWMLVLANRLPSS